MVYGLTTTTKGGVLSFLSSASIFSGQQLHLSHSRPLSLSMIPSLVEAVLSFALVLRAFGSCFDQGPLALRQLVSHCIVAKRAVLPVPHRLMCLERGGYVHTTLLACKQRVIRPKGPDTVFLFSLPSLSPTSRNRSCSKINETIFF